MGRRCAAPWVEEVSQLCCQTGCQSATWSAEGQANRSTEWVVPNRYLVGRKNRLIRCRRGMLRPYLVGGTNRVNRQIEPVLHWTGVSKR